MAVVKRVRRYEIRDEQKDKIIHRKIEGPADSNMAYTRVREEICKSKGISISDFEKRYTVDSAKTIVKFADKPWSDGDELRSEIENLSSIKNAFYIPPTVGRYGPPAFRVESNKPINKIRDNVKSYYDGLTVEERKGSVLVVISPNRYESSN